MLAVAGEGAPVHKSTFPGYCADKIKANPCIFAIYLAVIATLIVLMATMDFGGSTNAILGSTLPEIHIIFLAIAYWRYKAVSVALPSVVPAVVVALPSVVPAVVVALPSVVPAVVSLTLDSLEEMVKHLITKADPALNLSEDSIVDSEESIPLGAREGIYEYTSSTYVTYWVPLIPKKGGNGDEVVYLLLGKAPGTNNSVNERSPLEGLETAQQDELLSRLNFDSLFTRLAKGPEMSSFTTIKFSYSLTKLSGKSESFVGIETYEQLEDLFAGRHPDYRILIEEESDAVADLLPDRTYDFILWQQPVAQPAAILESKE